MFVLKLVALYGYAKFFIFLAQCRTMIPFSFLSILVRKTFFVNHEVNPFICGRANKQFRDDSVREPRKLPLLFDGNLTTGNTSINVLISPQQ